MAEDDAAQVKPPAFQEEIKDGIKFWVRRERPQVVQDSLQVTSLLVDDQRGIVAECELQILVFDAAPFEELADRGYPARVA